MPGVARLAHAHGLGATYSDAIGNSNSGETEALYLFFCFAVTLYWESLQNTADAQHQQQPLDWAMHHQ